MSAITELARYTLSMFKPPTKQTVSEWADEHRVLVSESSAEPGPWRTDRAPYQREIMDAFTQPGVWQIAIMASAQVGKALDVNTPIPTPAGFKRMGELQVGDVVYDEHRRRCNVTAISPIMHERPCFKVILSTGETIVADENHEWSVDRYIPAGTVRLFEKKTMIMTTKELAKCVGSPPFVYKASYSDITIVSVVKTVRSDTKCIQVDSNTHLYLAGLSLVPTHNSEIELNMMGYVIDNDPGPILYIQPTDKVAEDYSKRRIAPMVAACPTLNNKVFKAKGRDAANTINMKTFPGGSLAIIGANSPADLASKPVRYIFMDETDRFPASAGTEGDPQELAERRTETFRHNRKIVKTSTPTIKGASRIETDYMNGTQEEWHVECPYCHTYNYIHFKDIKFDKEEYKNERGDIDYHVTKVGWQCPKCKEITPEHAAKRLPAKWVVKNPKAIDNGIRSFRLNAFMSPWSDWRDICWKFLKAHKDQEKLKTFYNTILGETWELHVSDGLEEKLYHRREHYNAEVPSGVLVLTMGVDTQDNRLEYEVVGWDRDGQSWGINRGVIPGRADAPGVWNELDLLLDREWRFKTGYKGKISATFMDSGGHFTSDVYRECAKRQSKRIFPIKGEGGEGKQYCKPMKAGLAKDGIRFIIGVDDGKSGIMYEANIDEPGPNYMHFPMDYRAGYDLTFFKGLISERMIMKRSGGRSVTAWEKTFERNEPLDCRNYARAAYRYFNWAFDKLEKEIEGIEEEPVVITETQRKRKKERHIVSRGIKI